MYENYLLNPAAIAVVANNQENFSASPVSEDNIREWLRSNGQNAKYFCNKTLPPEVFSEDWVRSVDAANILKDLFGALSETRVEYKKTTHSTEITKWLIENSSDDLVEIAELIVSALNNVGA